MIHNCRSASAKYNSKCKKNQTELFAPVNSYIWLFKFISAQEGKLPTQKKTQRQNKNHVTGCNNLFIFCCCSVDLI